MKKHIKNQKAFTVIELICVLAILGILLALAAPAIGNVRARAQQRAFDATVRNLHMAALQFTMDFPNTETIWSGYVGQKRNPETVITDRNLFEAWSLYLDEWPADKTRDKDATFTVEIDKYGNVKISPDTYGGE